MPDQNTEPIDIPTLQQALDALKADIREREEAATALALRNAELRVNSSGAWLRARASAAC